jgi:putative hemolysin
MLTTIMIMFFLVLLIGIFSASEVALVVISDNKVDDDANLGNKKAIKVQKFTKNQRKYLISIQVFAGLVYLVNGAIGLDLFKEEILNWFSITNDFVNLLVIIIILFLLLIFHVVFGELIPKRLGNKYTIQIAYSTINLVMFLAWFMHPLVWFLNILSTVFGRFFGLLPNEGERKVTEEEIRTIVEESSKTGNIDENESEMIQNVFDFSDTSVEEIMTHRTEISALNVKSNKRQALDYVRVEQYTRFPVYEGSIDHIIGTLHVKDLLKYIDNNEEQFSIRSLLRPPYFIPESKKTNDLFKEMKKTKNHIAVVLDEYGGTAGIVTIEDLIEEIVGNISDEYDEDDNEIVKENEYTFVIDGLISINDAEDTLDADLPVDDYDTLSGFILGQLGRLPQEMEEVKIEYNGFIFEVLEIEDQVISKVKVTKTDKSEHKEE